MGMQMIMAGIAAAAMTAALATGEIGAKMASQSDAARTAPAGKPTSTKTKYCVMTAVTGSRMDRKVCRTRAEWLAEGFDPHAEK